MFVIVYGLKFLFTEQRLCTTFFSASWYLWRGLYFSPAEACRDSRDHPHPERGFSCPDSVLLLHSEVLNIYTTSSTLSLNCWGLMYKTVCRIFTKSWQDWPTKSENGMHKKVMIYKTMCTHTCKQFPLINRSLCRWICCIVNPQDTHILPEMQTIDHK